MILVLDLGSIGDRKAQPAEGADDILGDLGERMQASDAATATGEGEVGGLRRQGRLELEGFAAGAEEGLYLDLGRIDGLAGGRAFLSGEGAQLFHQRGELAAGPQIRALGALQCG